MKLSSSLSLFVFGQATILFLAFQPSLIDALATHASHPASAFVSNQCFRKGVQSIQVNF
jgi:hypothetical protein